MPRISFYLPREVEAILRRRAEAKKVSISDLVVDIVRREVGGGWPEGYFEEVVGGWEGEPLERPPQGRL